MFSYITIITLSIQRYVILQEFHVLYMEVDIKTLEHSQKDKKEQSFKSQNN